MSVLKGVDLSHSFDYTLFKGLNFSIDKKESISIIGVSGCGKSTLLHILSTLLTPDSGEVIYNDKSLYTLKNSEILDIRRNDFGIIFQSHYLFKGFSAYENIELGSKLTNSKFNEKIVKRLGIDKILNQKVGDLSGGQQQRVSIARVLAKQPKVIFADEPTGNLDKETASEVMEILFEYIDESGASLVLVTHDESIAMKCSQIYRLKSQNLEKIEKN